MIRGTTPTLEFVLPMDTGQLAEVFVTVSQDGSVVIDKQMKDLDLNGNKLSVRLTQEETLKLKSGCMAEIQIRARAVAGEAIASNIISVSAGRILKDGVI